MSINFINIDLVRLSQIALPIAKKHNTDNDGNLNETEYKNFMAEWNKEHSGESPLLMQLHTKTLTEEALKIAEQCDNIDDYKGVLTEEELKKFMDLCQEKKITNIFKKGVTPQSVITGDETATINYTGSEYKSKDNGSAKVRLKLFENWLKLDIMSFKGSDKFFHAVGNFEAMNAGDEKIVKEVCSGQDEDKRSNMQRPENDYTEDLYANFLGREFAKMYPDEDPHNLFSGLAPKGFDVEKSKSSAVELLKQESEGKDGYINQKLKQYTSYFKESYIVERFITEFKETLSPKPLVEKAKIYFNEKIDNTIDSFRKAFAPKPGNSNWKLINLNNSNKQTEELKQHDKSPKDKTLTA